MYNTVLCDDPVCENLFLCLLHSFTVCTWIIFCRYVRMDLKWREDVSQPLPLQFSACCLVDEQKPFTFLPNGVIGKTYCIHVPIHEHKYTYFTTSKILCLCNLHVAVANLHTCYIHVHIHVRVKKKYYTLAYMYSEHPYNYCTCTYSTYVYTCSSPV